MIDGGNRLAIDGGSRPRLRKREARTWTTAKEAEFCRALAESCNVKLAAETAGVSTSHAYVRRAKNATFRANWDKALGIGYAQLEMVMLERALHGVEKVITARDGSQTIMREYSDRLGLALLKMHRDGALAASNEQDPEDVAEAAERILARLKKIGERTATAIETKAAAGRTELIAWALGIARQ